jgi:hypothetical protein
MVCCHQSLELLKERMMVSSVVQYVFITACISFPLGSSEFCTRLPHGLSGQQTTIGGQPRLGDAMTLIDAQHFHDGKGYLLATGGRQPIGLQVNDVVVPFTEGSRDGCLAALSIVQVDQVEEKLENVGKVPPDIRVSVV